MFSKVIPVSDANVLSDWAADEAETDSRILDQLRAAHREISAETICGWCGGRVEYRGRGSQSSWWVHVDTGDHRCDDGRDCNSRVQWGDGVGYWTAEGQRRAKAAKAAAKEAARCR